MQKTKTVYRDKITGRLIPKKIAAKRKPGSWTKEVIAVHDPDSVNERVENAPVVREIYATGRRNGV